MATTTVSDALVVPQDPGTGLGSTDDPTSAAIVSLLASHEQGEYVKSGYGGGMSFVSHDGANNTVTIDTGACFIKDTSTSTTNDRGTGGNAQGQSEDDGSSPPTYDTEIPDGQIYLVLFPSQVTIDVSDSTLNQIWVNVTDVTSNNSVEVRSDGGGGTTAQPSDTFLKLGEANPDDATADTRANDDPALTTRSIETSESDITGETFIRPTRASDSSSISAGSWANAYDGAADDNLGEFNSSAQFSPGESGWYTIHINASVTASSSGDRIRGRIRNVTDGSNVGQGDDIDRHETNGSNINSISATVHVNLDSTKTYEIQVQNIDSSFTVSRFMNAGAIKRSVVHP